MGRRACAERKEIENMRKKAWRKSMRNFDAEKRADADFEIDFGVYLSCLRQYSRTGP